MNESESRFLFDMTALPLVEPDQQYTHLKTPLWTENKARFIARYLNSFTFVTKHGTYIDAFAGPQHEDSRYDTWAVNLVMQNKPAWLRNYYLFEKDSAQVNHLITLRDSYLATYKDEGNRTVEVIAGDCNRTLPEFLSKNPIKEKEATFCLLDQRSTECAWDTVKCVAAHKGSNGGHKIELFYFLAQSWMNRALKSWRKDVPNRFHRWWGKEGIKDFIALTSNERGQKIAERFKTELGYKYATPFPIQKRGKAGCVMFWMIHASDHPRATALMHDAYNYVGAGGSLNTPIEHQEMLKME
ncbi:MAG: three-Cys-motif partner protein TcmP [Cephaloticoccus sp.]|nr:three-Cys-motif partner protein TcmP [Cephaloticoccus sp.]